MCVYVCVCVHARVCVCVSPEKATDGPVHKMNIVSLKTLNTVDPLCVCPPQGH